MAVHGHHVGKGTYPWQKILYDEPLYIRGIISFNPYYNPIRLIILIIFKDTDEEAEIRRG